jgi:hypothetical protein
VGGSVGLGEGEVNERLVECLEMLLTLLEEDGRREVQGGARYMSFDTVLITKIGPYACNTGGPPGHASYCQSVSIVCAILPQHKIVASCVPTERDF